jgi:regulatory protein
VSIEADPDEVARLILLRQLTRGPRTRAQLEEACAKRGVPEPVAQRVLDRFTDLRLVDDEAFAHAWVESRHRGRGLSRKALRFELRRKGVADEVIDSALEKIDADDERDAALHLARSRAASLTGYELPTQQRRLQGLLARRGYSPALAAGVVREVLAERQRDDLGP